MRRLCLAVLLASSVGSAAADTGAPAPAAVTPPPRVAVVPGIAVNLDTGRVDALSQDLADALNSELEVDAIGGLEVRRQLPPDGIPAECVTTPACVSDVARRTGAQQLLFVVMVDSGAGGSVQVDVTWVDPATNRTESRPAIDVTTPSEARSRFGSAARQLLPAAKVRTRGGGTNNTLTINAPGMTEGKPRHFSTPAKISAAVGAVGLGAGIAFGLTTRSRYDQCENNLVACTDGKRDSIKNYGLLADIGFVVAAGAAVTTAVLYFTSAEEPRMIVTPTQDGAAISAVGRF